MAAKHANMVVNLRIMGNVIRKVGLMYINIYIRLENIKLHKDNLL